MNIRKLESLLKGVKSGKISIGEAFAHLRSLPFEDLGYARIDHHRSIRKGFPEVILGEGKTVSEILSIMKELKEKEQNILITRLGEEKAKGLRRVFPKSRYYPRSRVLTYFTHPVNVEGKGTILVVTAGTTDIPVAEEAAVTAMFMGNHVETLYDVGVAGIHRLLSERKRLEEARVLIVVAGMEGALPSVVGGLVSRPVIAVPTSVGYGTSFGGIAALLAMLNSCASGVAVVNIDNGFGAACIASLINRM
ncbi:MAG: 1-(5-phosphoribosyl)-5-amino-4-imidazole-carboxylate carboxylase [Deltaproteobacteria bacterium RBG_13_52_11b]|nr:MAG: 1-(5-phosphoribosyl)-5-amino-4-imidazole-carboxylate carboxylase [Deltaproteobacteria bacterium RBG_13_52_11b]